MNYGHFGLTLFTGISVGVCAATSNLVVALAGITGTCVFGLLLVLWMAHCESNAPNKRAGG